MITSSGRSKARSTLALPAAAVLALAGALTAVATTGNATNVAVEDDGADCPDRRLVQRVAGRGPVHGVRLPGHRHRHGARAHVRRAVARGADARAVT
ncbi:hypothetical protein GCM10010492_19200 [Saccharothrix mutabilis subsp. mutabilis]|uniref:Uncharacterized protein n=1 Tax=Saccharothrix mutabilis subsp. mutabilis TaxID=66855 RepID=A0ABN0TGN1_9PSEU